MVPAAPADTGKKRRDRCSRQGRGGYRWGRGRRLVRVTVMGPVASMLGSKPVRVAGEWYPPVGVISWGLMFFQAFLRRGCGIQRNPGGKLLVEKRNKITSPGVLMQGGVLSMGGCFLPCNTDTRLGLLSPFSSSRMVLLFAVFVGEEWCRHRPPPHTRQAVVTGARLNVRTRTAASREGLTGERKTASTSTTPKGQV